MRVVVNGKDREVPERTSLSEFVVSCNLKPEGVIAVVNETVVKRHIWSEKVLGEGDRIELVSLIGGG